MKKVNFLMGVIGVTLLLTSCLGEGSNSYTDQTYVYLDMDDMGQVYGKTFSGYSVSRLITSSSMVAMDNPSIKIMYYKWDEENGTKPLLIDGQNAYADNVTLLSSEVKDVTTTWLNMNELPDMESHDGFSEIGSLPFYSNNQSFMGDNWVFEYAYKAKKGQTGIVTFYKRNELEDGEIVIDINLTISGTAEENATEERVVDAIALKMGQLRAENSDKNELKIRFKYYKLDGNNEPVETKLPNALTWNIGE